MESKRALPGFAAYLGAAALWAINGSVSKSLLEAGISSMRLAQLRVTMAFLILLAIVAITRPAALRIRDRKELAILALYGLAGVTMTQWLYFIGITLLPVGVALVLEFTAPLMVAIWVKFAWNHHVPRLAWAGLATALTGLVLITEVWNGFRLDGLGVAASLGAAAALALYYLTGEKALGGDHPRDPLSLTMWGFAFATAFWAVFQPVWQFPWDFLNGSIELLPGTASPKVALVAWMVVLGTVVPFWLVLVAMKRISAQQAAGLGMTEPVLASFWAWFLLGENLSSWQIVGGVVTLSGVTLAEIARR